jgi:hypothetical protein
MKKTNWTNQPCQKEVDAFYKDKKEKKAKRKNK